MPKPIPGEARWLHKLRRDFIESLNQLNPGKSPLLVAVSGGADSVGLTLLLARETSHQLILAHFNHGLRGEESEQDAQFVSRLADTLNELYPGRIRHFAGIPPIPLLNKPGNLEANARKARYSWLVQMARDLGCESVLTGHHAQDQAETVLFHILRGTGPLGIKGIAPKKKLDKDINLLRPLLEFSPESLRRFLEALGQTFREDSSNQLGNFTRNRIRREVLPFLSEIMGRQVCPNLVGLAWHASHLHKREMAKLDRWVSHHAQFLGPQKVALPVADLKMLGKYSAMGIIPQIAKILNWPRGALTRRHYRAFWNQIQKQVSTVMFPQGIRSSLDRSGEVLTLTWSPQIPSLD